MNLESIRTALVLAPHPDDGEFGCGGTLNKLAALNADVHYVAFSPCAKSLPEGMSGNDLFDELAKAAEALGIGNEFVETHNFPVREFPAYRQEILEELIALRKRISPDLVFVPNANDVHQDHHVIYEEGLRAFKHSTLLGYELPWNSLHFSSTCHVKLDESNLEAKFEAVQAYRSQKGRVYSDREFLKGLAKVRGLQVNAEFAEAFELIRLVIN